MKKYKLPSKSKRFDSGNLATDLELIRRMTKELGNDFRNTRTLLKLWCNYMSDVANFTDNNTLTIPSVGRLHTDTKLIKDNFYNKSFYQKNALRSKYGVLKRHIEDNKGIYSFHKRGLSLLNVKDTEGLQYYGNSYKTAEYIENFQNGMYEELVNLGR